MSPWHFWLLLGVCVGAGGWELLRQYFSNTFNQR